MTVRIKSKWAVVDNRSGCIVRRFVNRIEANSYAKSLNHQLPGGAVRYVVEEVCHESH